MTCGPPPPGPQAVLPPDFSDKSWSEKRDEEMEREALLEHRHEVTLRTLPVSLRAARPTIQDIERQLQIKIIEHTRRGSDQYREGVCVSVCVCVCVCVRVCVSVCLEVCSILCMHGHIFGSCCKT